MNGRAPARGQSLRALIKVATAVPKTSPGQAGARLAADPGPARPHDLAAAQRPRIPDQRRAVPGLALVSARYDRMPRADCQATDLAASEHVMLSGSATGAVTLILALVLR